MKEVSPSRCWLERKNLSVSQIDDSIDSEMESTSESERKSLFSKEN
jgi:hypothetical protein